MYIYIDVLHACADWKNNVKGLSMDPYMATIYIRVCVCVYSIVGVFDVSTLQSVCETLIEDVTEAFRNENKVNVSPYSMDTIVKTVTCSMDTMMNTWAYTLKIMMKTLKHAMMIMTNTLKHSIIIIERFNVFITLFIECPTIFTIVSIDDAIVFTITFNAYK